MPYIRNLVYILVFLNDIAKDPIDTILAGMAMFQAIEDNIINMTRAIHEY